MRLTRFRSFELDLKAAELRSENRVIRLQGKPFQILILLLENSGDVVTRDEIRKRLWPEDTIVEFDHGIGTAVKKLRQALGDAAGEPRYIETLARRGYRWIAGVNWADGKSSNTRAIATRKGSTRQRSVRDANIDSIAVLPFANLSADPGNEYFSDGLAEEILNALSRVPGLKVTARTSSFSFRGKDQDVRRIGDELGAGAILEGSVRRSGDHIRVTAQLIDTSDGYHLWSDKYDCKMVDVFAVQDHISQAIVSNLHAQLDGNTQTSGRHPAKVEAYEAYLKGRYQYAKQFTQPTDAALARARTFYEEAIALDPQYAPAYSRLAMCYFAISQLGLGPARMLMPLARNVAGRAAELDPTDSEANAVAGLVAAVFDYDWKEALRRCELALDCDRVSLTARQLCAQFIFLPLRRFQDAATALEPLLNRDPLSPLPRKTLADAFAYQGDHSQAIEQLGRVLELDDRFWLAHFSLGNVYTAQGATKEAIQALERGLQIATFPQMLGMLAANYSRAGEEAQAQHALRRIAGLQEPNGRAKAWMSFYLVSGDVERAANCVDELIEGRDPDAVALNYQPASVREHPRIHSSLSKMNLACERVGLDEK